MATNIAETSLTIDGVRIVIDAGLERRQRFDPNSGMSRLETVAISRAAADQRRGRAGRTAPGVCYRLWSESAHAALASQAPAEIAEADLAPLVLDLACWGCTDPASLAWLDSPPAATFAQARDLLRRFGAIDEQNRVTAIGRQMAQLAVHPRLAHMIVRAEPLGLRTLACEIAALLAERDPLRTPPGQRDPDLRHRIDVLHGMPAPPGCTIDARALQQARRSLQVLRATGRENGNLARCCRRRHPTRCVRRIAAGVRVSRSHRARARRRGRALPAQQRPRRPVAGAVGARTQRGDRRGGHRCG